MTDARAGNWQALDRERAYPTAFVQALTDEGWLSILIPQAYGGAGLQLSAAAGGALALGETRAMAAEPWNAWANSSITWCFSPSTKITSLKKSPNSMGSMPM